MILDRRPPEEAADWLRFARKDLAAARPVLKVDPTLIRQALQHAQQCAEKALKALLIAKNQPYSLTHSIETLRRLCGAIDATLEPPARACVDLSPFSTVMRYPGEESDPSLSETLVWVDAAEALLVAVNDRLRVS